jgi:phosphatidylethanolamine/phosphatidyl-N-methylethanolamine N-methyltransferase
MGSMSMGSGHADSSTKQPVAARRKKGVASDISLFLAESIRSFSATASVIPSSKYLAAALVRAIDFSQARVIVDLGVGTGAVSFEIMRRLRPEAKLYALDINPAFVAHVQERIRDPRFVALVGSAEDLGQLLRAHSVDRADAIVSSLGLSNMSDQLRTSIIKQAIAQLSKDGVLSQFQYLHVSGEPNWTRNIGLNRFSEERFLRQHFRKVSAEKVIRNFPPAAVFTCWPH